jgi:hypothetical protein
MCVEKGSIYICLIYFIFMNYAGLIYILLGFLFFWLILFDYKQGDFFTSNWRWSEWNLKSDGLSYYFPLIVRGLVGLILIGFGIWVLLS